MEFGHSIVKFSSENKNNVLSEQQTMDVKAITVTLTVIL